MNSKHIDQTTTQALPTLSQAAHLSRGFSVDRTTMLQCNKSFGSGDPRAFEKPPATQTLEQAIKGNRRVAAEQQSEFVFSRGGLSRNAQQASRGAASIARATFHKRRLHQSESCALIMCGKLLILGDFWGGKANPRRQGHIHRQGNTMRFSTALPRFGNWLAVVGIVGLSSLLASCGGGGVSSGGVQVGPLSIQPQGQSLYPGVPFTFSVQGGQRPYDITSNEQTLIPSPGIVNTTSFTVVPNNPGVVDLGQDPNEVPSRTVRLSVRDFVGTIVTSEVKVLQNFLLGYSFGIFGTDNTQNNQISCDSTGVVCDGSARLFQIRPTTDGRIQVNKQVRLQVIYPANVVGFVNDQGQGLLNTVTITTDEQGRGAVRIGALQGAATQIALVRLTDVRTLNAPGGPVYADYYFQVVQQTAPVRDLVVIPNAVEFTGPDDVTCGGGSVDAYIFGGVPPYRVVSTTPNGVSVNPSTVSAEGDRTTITASTQACTADLVSQVIVTDTATGTQKTVTVTRKKGPAATGGGGGGAANCSLSPLPPQCVISASVNPQLSPASPLGCGANATIAISGGPGSGYNMSVSPNNAPITVTPTTLTAAGQVTVTRTNTAGSLAGSASVVISSGSVTTTVAIPYAACP